MQNPYERAAAERDGDDEFHDLASSLAHNPGMPIASIAVDGLMKQLKPWSYAVLPDQRGMGVRTFRRALSASVDVLDLPVDETEVYEGSGSTIFLQSRRLKAEDFLRIIDIERAIRATSSTEQQMIKAARQAKIDRGATLAALEEPKPAYEGVAKLFHDAKKNKSVDEDQPYTGPQGVILSQVTLHESRSKVAKTLQTSDSEYSRTMSPLRKQFGLQDYYDEVLFGLSFELADLDHVEPNIVSGSEFVAERQEGYIADHFDYQPEGKGRGSRHSTSTSVFRITKRLGMNMHELLVHSIKDGIVEVPDRSVYEEYAASTAL